MDFREEDQIEMSGHLRVQWTVLPGTAPRPLLPCKRCGTVQPFHSTGKFRLNAHKKRLDAWLIYRCAACAARWNRPMFERRGVGEIEEPLLRDLHANDQDLAASFAFDVGSLRRYASRIDEATGFQVQKRILSAGAPPWSAFEIALVVPVATSVRMDKMLAAELGLSRARIRRLESQNRISLSGCGGRGLARPVRDGARIGLTLQELLEETDIVAAATGRSM